MVYLPTFHEERLLLAQGLKIVAGVDEAGCGCWAGPVYAAAIILPLNSRLRLIRDSKKLSLKQRETTVAQFIEKKYVWAVGTATSQEIDTLNIRRAGALAMLRAIQALSIKPEYVLSDAFKIPGLDIPCKNIIRGDRNVKSIAAASIIAKMERDRHMLKMDERYPEYGFAKHKGYGTKQHQLALKKFGLSPIHRLSYQPIKNFLK